MQPTARRIALVAVQAALAAAGIFAVMLLFSRPAHAATAALSPLKATQTSTLSSGHIDGRLGHVARDLDGQLGHVSRDLDGRLRHVVGDPDGQLGDVAGHHLG